MLSILVETLCKEKENIHEENSVPAVLCRAAAVPARR